MVAAVHNRSFIVDVECWKCRTIHSIILNKDDFMGYMAGSVGINIFDYLSMDDRELLISQTCGSCFDDLFPPLDNAE